MRFITYVGLAALLVAGSVMTGYVIGRAARAVGSSVSNAGGNIPSREYWTEVNIAVPAGAEEAFLVRQVGPLIHETLAGSYSVWFFFWESELRVRFRWRDAATQAVGKTKLFETLEAWKRNGVILVWWEGTHGVRGKHYVGEAAMYGESVWPTIQRDWMAGSELVLAILKAETAGSLPRSRDFYWSRHTHLFSNQLFFSEQLSQKWAKEVRLAVAQALVYARLVEALGRVGYGDVVGALEELMRFLQRAENNGRR